MAAKIRLDDLVLERELVLDRDQAQRRIMAGEVLVAGQIVYQPATFVPKDAEITLSEGRRYVSRGGEKLEAALKVFDVNAAGKVCADVGSSTGGFTDCLLKNGAERVYTIDVGQGILAWKIRQDPRVVVMENTNARHLQRLPESIDLVTIDVSFISVTILLPVIKGWFNPGKETSTAANKTGGEIIVLIKPQFEAEYRVVSLGRGVIQDKAVHEQVLESILSSAVQGGYQVKGLLRSPLLGVKGNQEFLAHLTWLGSGEPDFKSLISQVLR